MKRARPDEWVSLETNRAKSAPADLDDSIFYDCLYGAENITEESDELVSEKLREIEREIDKLSNKLNETYFIALEKEMKEKVKYVRSKEFLVSFLRAEKFDARKAALRLVLFLKFKMELFGPEKLTCRIRQDDLEELDKKVLSSGFCHFGGVDCGGRAVLCFRRERLKQCGMLGKPFVPNILRVLFYLTMFATENYEQTQLKGLVGIRWQINSSMSLKELSMTFVSKGRMFAQVMPFRIAATHSCCSDGIERKCAIWMESIMSKQRLHMSRIHGPSAAACLAGLSKFGIDVDSLPVSASGDFKVDTVERQLELMRQKELQKMLCEMEDITCNPESKVELMRQMKLQTMLRPMEDIACCNGKESAVLSDDLKKSNILGKVDRPLLDRPSVSQGLSSQGLSDDHLPLRLMRILNHNTFSDSIWWIRDGTAFAIEKTTFTKTVLAKEFKGIKFDSFDRRLRRWDFRRLPWQKGAVGVNIAEYEHPLFQKRSPHLLQQWDNASNVKDKFPIRLMKIVKSNKDSDAIWWIRDGKAIAIQREKFSCGILKTNFKGLKFDSFCRNMIRWGFKRLPNEELFNNNVFLFYHEMFRQNVPVTPGLLEKWNRK